MRRIICLITMLVVFASWAGETTPGLLIAPAGNWVLSFKVGQIEITGDGWVSKASADFIKNNIRWWAARIPARTIKTFTFVSHNTLAGHREIGGHSVNRFQLGLFFAEYFPEFPLAETFYDLGCATAVSDPVARIDGWLTAAPHLQRAIGTGGLHGSLNQLVRVSKSKIGGLEVYDRGEPPLPPSDPRAYLLRERSLSDISSQSLSAMDIYGLYRTRPARPHQNIVPLEGERRPIPDPTRLNHFIMAVGVRPIPSGPVEGEIGQYFALKEWRALADPAVSSSELKSLGKLGLQVVRMLSREFTSGPP